MTVSSTVARNIDTCNGVTTVRTIPFKLLDETHLNVYRFTIATSVVSAALTLGVDYSVQNVGSDNAQYTMLLGADSSAYKLIVIRNVPFSQSTDYVQNDSFPAESHEAALDKLTMISQQMKDTMNRAAAFPLFADPALAAVLPIPVDGYGLIWSGTGGTIVNTSVSMATLQTQAAALYAIAADITTVASISANVVSVDGNAAHINTVAGISADVTAVAAISTAVTNVNGISTAVTNVNTIRTNVTTVAGISANVTTVAGISGNVTTVAGINANVTTVAGISANITTLAPIASNITTVAGISANVTTVATAITNINSVAADLTNINLVAADLTNINLVAADLTNINLVAADLTNIDAIAGDLTNINNASTYANNASSSATAAAASAAAAAAAVSGISMRGSCRVAATGPLTVTYANGVLGVGATLTNAGAQAAFAADGVTLSVGERVLIPLQASALQNGMYTLTVAGTGATNWVLTRATDYDEASEVVEGTATIIEEGTVNASHIYVMTHHGAITMGTTAIDFTSLTANATSANTLTTPRAIYGNNFDGSAALTQIIASTYGGTGNGWAKFSGPTTSEKTFTLPDASCTILTSNALVTAAQGGTANGFFAVSGPASSTKTFTFPNASATVLTDNAAVTAAQGGTGISTSASTGIAQVAAGTWSVSTALGSGTTATTQSAADNSTKVATTAYVDAARYGGATVTSSGTSITLTNASNRVQDINLTAADLYVQLPDATTLTAAGGEIFVIRNKGAYTFIVQDAGGNLVAVLSPNAAFTFFASSIGSANGTWIPANNGGDFTPYISHTALIAETTGASNGGSSICPLTATTSLLIYSDITNTVVKAVVITISNGTTTSAGTPVTVISEASNGSNVVCALSATLAVVSWYRSAATTACKVCSLSISGTTITVNTPATVSSTSSPQPVAIFPISATSAMLFYTQSTTGIFGVVLSSISTTITVNTPQSQTTVGAAASGGVLCVVPLSTTAYLVAYPGTSSFLCFVVFTVSSVTVTVNTPLTNQSNSAVFSTLVMCALSSTKAALVFTSGGVTYAGIVSISGTTPSVGALNLITNYTDITNANGLTLTNIGNTLYLISNYGIIAGYALILTMLKADIQNNLVVPLGANWQMIAYTGVNGTGQNNGVVNNSFAIMTSTASAVKLAFTTNGGSSATNVNTQVIDLMAT